MMPPKITIITVTLNAKPTIAKAIESVISQTYQHIEYIVIDGNSTDGTQNIVSQYADKIAKFISEPDTGIYNAMNKGIKHATGDFIYSLGADDYLVDSDVITDIANFLMERPDCKFLYGNIEVRSTGNINHIYKPVPPQLILDNLITGCLPHQASFAHSSLFDDPEIGLFSEHYKTASDYEWFIKMATKLHNQPNTIAYIDRVVASYNADGSSGNLRKMSNILTEVFDVQNRAPIYQTNYWLRRRIAKYQQILIDPQGQWGLYRLETRLGLVPILKKVFRKKILITILRTAKVQLVGGIVKKVKSLLRGVPMPSSQLDQVIPAEIKDDELASAITDIVASGEIYTILEIGSSSGEGSTKAFIDGILRSPSQPRLYGMEVSLPRFRALQDRYGQYDFVRFYHTSSVSIDKFPTKQEVISFYKTVKSNLNHYPPVEILRWLNQDIQYLQNHPEIPQGGIARIKAENNIDKFDCVLIDGSEFTGRVELEEVYGAGIIILDDINTYKNYYSHQQLLQDTNYILAKCNPHLRNGYSIFRRVDLPPLSIELPIHFFTIVLNGQPFIQYHIEVFKKLPFRWHWHIMEGVADLKHDTAWSLKHGGRITDDLHNNGLSKDGTTEYIDEIVSQYPNNITVYRKPLGQFWDGKREMVSAPLNNIKEECLLWQVDVDELWTLNQITTTRQLFIQYPEKTAAFYWCWYFVGEHLVVSTRNCYSQNPHQEWLRTWRFQPEYRWEAHEPPILVNQHGKNLAKINPFTHKDTEKYGLIFQHFAYVTAEQIAFKEKYYGYRNATEQWLKLQKVDQFPVHLKNYLGWVKDETLIDTAQMLGVCPIAHKQDDTGCWHFSYSEHSDLKDKKDPRPVCVIDGVIFQLNPKGGIARVWYSLLKEWAKGDFAKQMIIVDRGGTAPRIEGCRYIVTESYNPQNSEHDQVLLQEICSRCDADLFMSTYYTTSYKTPSIMMVYDMIPEMFGTDLADSQWRDKKRAIRSAYSYISISQNSADDLRLFYPDIPQELVTVAYPAVDNSIFHPASEIEIAQFKAKYNLDKPYFLMVGDRIGFKGYKNASYFFRAFAKLANNHEYIVLCTGGNRNLETDIAEYTHSLDVRLFNLSDEELRSAYTGAICLVYVSLYEGFGIPVLEAMSCACPVITCQNSSLTEVTGEAALYVDGYDEDILLKSLIDIQQPEVRNRLIAAGMKQSKKFSWAKMATEVSDALQKAYLTILSNPALIVYKETEQPEGIGLVTAEGSFNQDAVTHQEILRLREEVDLLKTEVTLMRQSKFWKMRNMWLKIKNLGRKIKTKVVKVLETN